jgi:hypothetical protein
MENARKQRIYFGILLVLSSIFFYALSFAIFHDARNEAFYLFQDIGFVFIQVLLVTVVIEQLLNYREKMNLISKLNMVIGVFFSEVGTPLFEHFLKFDASSQNISKHLKVAKDWSKKSFQTAIGIVKDYQSDIDCKTGNLAALKQFMAEKKDFLLGLLENPNLLEHERFTELLWAVFHLTEELSYRKGIENLPRADFDHLAGDIKRAYLLLIREWLNHLEHLKSSYPYLFSLALRTNPFDPEAEVEIKS